MGATLHRYATGYTGEQKFSVRIFILSGPDVLYILSPLVCPGCIQRSFFARFGAEKHSDVAFTSGLNKSQPKTFQTPEKTILSLSETDGFDKIFMAT